jgi:DNA-binding transcriptional regulator YdaS (Cro superfamily)
MDDVDIELARASIDKAAELVAQGSYNRLAGKLDVTKQALSKWRVDGRVPALRACQIEVLTSGKVKWWQLAPHVRREVEQAN